MRLVVCTLFEGHYHYGAAALINSLYHNNYRGIVYVGYRGALPEWAAQAKKTPTVAWNDASALQITQDLCVIFLPIETEFHLTNYKPFFMLKLFEIFASELEAIVYLDLSNLGILWRFLST
jgi:hypothetical protein